MDEEFLNRVSRERLSSRQIDELIGLTRGILADGKISEEEVRFLQKWLAANLHITDQPIIRILYDRIAQMLSDGVIDKDEKKELFDTLNKFSQGDFEIGEALKSTTLPLCDPPPSLLFEGKHYCFTGTFIFGNRKECETAVIERGATVGPLTMKTNFLVIGTYATDSWKHTSFGNKIIKATSYRDKGKPISLISEQHWQSFL